VGKKNTTFIKINGHRYDPTSGQLLDDETTEQAPQAPRRIINDVVRVAKPSARVQSMPVAPEPVIPSQPMPKRPVMDIRPVHHVVAHQPEHTKTLMRTAVSRPAPNSQTRFKTVTRTDILAKNPTFSVIPKKAALQIDEHRQARAHRVAKSQLVRRFAPIDTTIFQPGDIIIPEHAALKFNPALLAADQQAKSQSMDVFERALARADAHQEPLVNPKQLAKQTRKQLKQASRANRQPIRHRTVSIVAASLAVLLTTGFIAYQDRSNLILHYASAEAGFHASLPSYKPSGFSVGTFHYNPGKISVAFNNNAGQQTFTLTQKPSNWDSQTLLESVVEASGKPYQTLQSDGETIYIYNNNNATWVNNGILYQLSSDDSLSTSQVLNIATSL
jgi:hypothetical protein